jgi:hypothetical protein
MRPCKKYWFLGFLTRARGGTLCYAIMLRRVYTREAAVWARSQEYTGSRGYIRTWTHTWGRGHARDTCTHPGFVRGSGGGDLNSHPSGRGPTDEFSLFLSRETSPGVNVPRHGGRRGRPSQEDMAQDHRSKQQGTPRGLTGVETQGSSAGARWSSRKLKRARIWVD